MSAADFYDAMEPFYDLIYPDWDASMNRQAAAIAKIIAEKFGNSVKTILDATCGIGTQSLGFARRGFEVTASDVSPQSVERLRREAGARQLNIPASICDVRQLWTQHRKQFDLLISCDNSLPHLKTEDELPKALKEMFHCTRPGGGCLITVRDYATENLQGLQIRPYGIRKLNGKNLIAFQTWECSPESYEVTMHFVEDDGQTSPICHAMRSTYYPITTDQLMKLMTEAGFSEVQRLDGVFFQPALIGAKIAP